ncbi:Isochorismatase family [Seminavis robusta]|uniref:Isochorismatase family n=1 Tax=Seminavis robusta TaxID=568900 RepID=A0A9N8H9C3_9STRA|nr:Isochorismatase family [Seminavis robusta]|eukprot:Sro200_g084870.1 Isochorismatase family (232) ;mRNA; r:74472-75380
MPAAAYNKIFTPEDLRIVFIDHQPQMTFGVSNIDKQQLRHTSCTGYQGVQCPYHIDCCRGESFILWLHPARTLGRFGMSKIDCGAHRMNYLDDKGFRAAIRATGKKNMIMTGLLSEGCATWPTIEMLGEGYNIFMVEGCCGATGEAAHEAALSRCNCSLDYHSLSAGWQRDLARRVHYTGCDYDNLMNLLKPQAGAERTCTEWELSIPTPWCASKSRAPSILIVDAMFNMW